MNLAELKELIENKMMIQHIYEPVTLKTVILSKATEVML
jgi:hypothetical protein